jgi:hypothetical protein
MDKNEPNKYQTVETFLATCWICCEEYWKEQARDILTKTPSSPEVIDGIWTIEEGAVFDLAKRLQKAFAVCASENEVSLHSRLLNHALSQVNWAQIAASLLWEIDSDGIDGSFLDLDTRTQAIERGILIDVSEIAGEVGITVPTVLTAGAWQKFVKVPDDMPKHCERDRLWNLLNMLYANLRRNPQDDYFRFDVLVTNDHNPPRPLSLKAILGPDDTGNSAFTILLPQED